jgi:hypothetical protein
MTSVAVVLQAPTVLLTNSLGFHPIPVAGLIAAD